MIDTLRRITLSLGLALLLGACIDTVPPSGSSGLPSSSAVFSAGVPSCAIAREDCQPALPEPGP